MNFRHIIMLAAICLGMSACRHRNFEYDSGRFGYVEVVFDWRNDPSASPKSMTLLLYPREGGEPERYDFVGREGGIIRVAPGVYNAICFNSDVREVEYLGEQEFGAFEITTPQLDAAQFESTLSVRSSGLPVAPGTEDQLMMEQPPMMWSSSEMGVNITVNTKPSEDSGLERKKFEHQVITLYPRPIVDTYVVTVKNVRNPQYLKTLSGSISDMSDGYYAGPQVDADTESILLFNLAHNIGESNAEGTFLTFGHCPGPRRTHFLLLYAILTDGSKYYYEFDVSDQAHNPPDEHGIYHIIVEFIDIPEPGGSGLSPDVDTWGSLDIFLDT